MKLIIRKPSFSSSEIKEKLYQNTTTGSFFVNGILKNNIDIKVNGLSNDFIQTICM
jgi:hypothetical protein